MFCTYCGEKNLKKAQFCNKCGAKIDTEKPKEKRIKESQEIERAEILRQIIEKSENFFSNKLFDTLPDINYGSDATRTFLYTAKAQGIKFGLKDKELYNFVRDEIVSQGFLFHAFNNEYIKENKMLEMISKYVTYIFPDLVNFSKCFHKKAEIIRFNVLRLSDAIIWAGISGTDIKDILESSVIPPSLKSILIYLNNLSIRILTLGVSLDLFFKNSDFSYFSSNSEENRTKLRELIFRNLKSFKEEYKTT